MGARISLKLAEGMTGMTEKIFLNIKNKSKIGVSCNTHTVRESVLIQDRILSAA